MKCEKCGHFNPYWRTDWRDTEREFAKPEDVKWWSMSDMPEETRLALEIGKIVEWNGFAWKQSKKFVRRIPVEIYKARGKWGLPYKAKDYFDAIKHPSNLRIKAYESSPEK
jgi:hypothetical protein